MIDVLWAAKAEKLVLADEGANLSSAKRKEPLSMSKMYVT